MVVESLDSVVNPVPNIPDMVAESVYGGLGMGLPGRIRIKVQIVPMSRIPEYHVMATGKISIRGSGTPVVPNQSVSILDNSRNCIRQQVEVMAHVRIAR